MTANQQLYKVALHIQWNDPLTFSNVYLRIGGMHILMNCVGCIGTLMDNSGLLELLTGPFGGVKKMLTGKKFPDNVRALRILTEELLRSVFASYQIETMDGLIAVLEELSKKKELNCLIIG